MSSAPATGGGGFGGFGQQQKPLTGGGGFPNAQGGQLSIKRLSPFHSGLCGIIVAIMADMLCMNVFLSLSPHIHANMHDIAWLEMLIIREDGPHAKLTPFIDFDTNPHLCICVHAWCKPDPMSGGGGGFGAFGSSQRGAPGVSPVVGISSRMNSPSGASGGRGGGSGPVFGRGVRSQQQQQQQQQPDSGGGDKIWVNPAVVAAAAAATAGGAGPWRRGGGGRGAGPGVGNGGSSNAVVGGGGGGGAPVDDARAKAARALRFQTGAAGASSDLDPSVPAPRAQRAPRGAPVGGATAGFGGRQQFPQVRYEIAFGLCLQYDPLVD